MENSTNDCHTPQASQGVVSPSPDNIAQERSPNKILTEILKNLFTFFTCLSILSMGYFHVLPSFHSFFLENELGMKKSRTCLMFIFEAIGYLGGIFFGLKCSDLQIKDKFQNFLIIIVKIISIIAVSITPSILESASLCTVYFLAAVSLAGVVSYSKKKALSHWKGKFGIILPFFSFIKSFGHLIGCFILKDCIEMNFGDTSSSGMITFHDDSYNPYTKGFLYLDGIIFLSLIPYLILLVVPLNSKINFPDADLEERKTTRSFKVFAISTTILLSVINGIVNNSYYNRIGPKLKLKDEATLLTIYWGSICFGSITTIFLCRKLHPFAIIVLKVFIQIVSGVLLYNYETSYLITWIGTACYAFANSCMQSCTLLWLERYLEVTPNLVVGLDLAEVLPNLVITIIMAGETAIKVLLGVPIAYTLVFVFQMLIFFPFGEKYYFDYGNKRSCIRVFPIVLNEHIHRDHESSTENRSINEQITRNEWEERDTESKIENEEHSEVSVGRTDRRRAGTSKTRRTIYTSASGN